jgi:hypothetical protein
MKAVLQCTGACLASQQAALMPNLQTVPGFEASVVCVEIKPKAGSLPRSSGIHPSNRIKYKVSRYQMHQILKVQQVGLHPLRRHVPPSIVAGSVNLEVPLNALSFRKLLSS